MDDTGRRLKSRRQQASLTQKQLSEMSGVMQSMISDVENNNRDITVKNLKKLLYAMKISIQDFYADEFTSEAFDVFSFRHKYSILPDEQKCIIDKLLNFLSEAVAAKSDKSNTTGLQISGVSAAGSPVFNHAIDDDLVSVPKKYLDNSRFFAVKVKGNSMEPRIPNGSSVVVQVNAQPLDGEIALIYLEGGEEGEYTIKQFFKHSDYFELVSLNKNHPPKSLPYNKLISAQKVVFIVPPDSSHVE